MPINHRPRLPLTAFMLVFATGCATATPHDTASDGGDPGSASRATEATVPGSASRATEAAGVPVAAAASSRDPASGDPARTQPGAEKPSGADRATRDPTTGAARPQRVNTGDDRTRALAPPVRTEPQAGGNWLADASFEGHLRADEGQPWWNPLLVQNSLAWVEFDIARGVAHTGDRSAHLHMDSDAQPGATRVHGVVQEVATPTLPRYISGWYRVENWQRGAEKQYIQGVVIARNPSNIPPALGARGGANASVQVAMTLAGVTEPPLNMLNRRFEITGPAEPVEGEWTFFEFDLHEMFKEHWGMVPENQDNTRAFFEVRYDRRAPGPAASTADVYFDDLYLGDESRSPTP